jgi:methyl-accepting chemotaxis protein
MIRGTLARAIGLSLIIGGILGVCVSVAGIVLVWASAGPVNRQVAVFAGTSQEALAGASQMLTVTAQALDTAQMQLAGVDGTLGSVAVSLQDTASTTRAFGRLASGDLAQVITDTRTALKLVSTTAGAVDDTLRVVTQLPLVGSGRYRPKVPLATSIDRVQQSLAPVPGQLVDIGDQLGSAAGSIETIGGSLGRVGANVSQAEASLRQARDAVGSYQQTVAGLQDRAAHLEEDIARVLRIARAFATLALLWLLVAQVGLLTQGYEWLRREDVG